MLISSVVLGALAGVATGGDIRRLGNLRIRFWWLAVAMLAARFIAPLLPAPLILYLLSMGVLVAIGVLNRHVPGALAIAFGTLLNVVAIAANGAMPVSAEAAAAAGASVPNDALHELLVDDTRLKFLTDIIPVALVRNVYSVGDFVIAAGGFWLTFAVTAGRRRSDRTVATGSDV